jgi:hypothetical protein
MLLKREGSMNRSEQFQITLEAKPSAVPAIVRIRKLLKIASRVLGLRCVEIREKK